MKNSGLDAFNVVWTSPSRDASESMPCGGGDIGLNVWVENGDVLFYLARSGSLDELNEYLKLGRVRLRLDPNPFAAGTASFRQELVLREGHVEIRGGDVLVRVWVEVQRPIVHVEVESSREISVTAAYENWRLTEELVADTTRRHACFELLCYPGEVRLSPDHVTHADGGVLFYHRNPPDNWLRRMQIEQQGLMAVAGEIPDDLSHRTFGGFMAGEGFQPAGETAGVYQTRAYTGWLLRSEKPAHRHHLRVCTHIAQTETLGAWQAELCALVNAQDVGREATVEWWREFWARSWITIQPDQPDAGSRAWRIGRNYTLFRYQLGCNAFGEYPSKFNGGSFTFDANLVGDDFKAHGPDWRQWGGGVFTAQNQRLLYWPLLKTGDAEAMRPQFELYRKALPGARAHARVHFGHEGAVYCEYIGVPGLEIGMGYGWTSSKRLRGPEIPFGDPRADGGHHYGEPVEKGVMSCKPIAMHWESQLEHAYMILEYRRFTGADITEYIPFIENAVVFFDEHYRARERMRSGRDLDENGHLVLFPAKACETYRGAKNPADLIAGLLACLDAIDQLDAGLLQLRDKAYYRQLRTTIPPFSYGETAGKRVILPAASWKEYGNAEIPQLYPLFPFNRFALGRDDLQPFRDAYELGEFHKGNVVSWHQDGIFFARMGQTEKAADFNARKLDDSERRFPTFWGPGHDWVPDHNWGGSGMIGLQEMLMQTIGDEIRLLPAWPAEWDVDFKLHAPGQTVVTGRVRDGQLVDLDVQPESRRKDVVAQGAYQVPMARCAERHQAPPPLQEPWKAELLKHPLRAYCIDFNWLVRKEGNVFPEPGHWADADPAAHVKWYKDAGANCIQTFVLSANGYAWYKGGPVPEQPGLKHDFLVEVVRQGHEERMLVMGYYCIAANTLWGKLHPEESYGTPSWMHIPLTTDYIDYLCVSVEDALKKTGIDGFMLDWLQNTSGQWLDCEKVMYAELMGVPFPGADKVTAADREKFDDLAVNRCWTRIRDTARRVKPDCILWPNYLQHVKREGVDWLLNEGPDVEATETARQKLDGRPIRLVQNQVGWSNHDARRVFSNPYYKNWDFYGFAAPYDNSLPLPVAEYLGRPVADFNGTDPMTINDRNIAALIRFFRGKPVDPPPPWPLDLRCEYRVQPLGIDTASPRLGWKIGTANPEIERGVVQTGYQVLVASSRGVLRNDQGDLWDSGKVEGEESVLVEYAGKPLVSRMRCFWKVRVWTRAADLGDPVVSAWSEPAMWTMGLLQPEEWGAARWIQWTPAPEAVPVAEDGTPVEIRDLCPWLRKSFELAAAPERALVRLNISGYAELYINGHKVGADVLTPAIANPEHRTFYVTYDVTGHLRAGRNVIGLWLGRGWAKELPLVRAELAAQVAGQTVCVVTDAGWSGCASHYRHIGKWQWSNFGGERLDARRQRPDWCQPGGAEDGWTPVTVVTGPEVPAVAQPVPLNRLGAGIPAVTVTRLGPEQQVIDFGVAVSGWLRLAMPALEPGQVVKLSFADAETTYTKNGPGGYQTFSQVSEFVSAGQPGEVFEHKFNYAGFQYVVVDGLAAKLSPADATAYLIETDLEPAGDFSCSNGLLNRIHGLTQWTLRCLNLGGYLVDCPHRERLGYGGDGQVAVEGFMHGFRADAFYRKWLADWRLRQKPDGALPNVAPCAEGGGGPGWPGFVAAVTWRHYLHYGDRQVVEENFTTIRRYADWLEAKCQDDVLRQYGNKWSFIGDWVPPERGMDTANWPSQKAAELFNNSCRIYHWGLLARLASVLGDQVEVRRCEERLKAIRAAVHQAFYDAEAGHYGVDEQAYYVMPLMTGITPAELRPALLARLERNILEKNRGHLDTGLFATYFMMEYLREIGRNDLVLAMFNQETYPGWGYMLAQGASTCWEQWNGNFSRIHNCFTSADNWLYQGLAGIQPDPAGPGFRRSLIKPALVGDLTWVKAHYDSVHGRISSHWRRAGASVTLEVTIPANTTATVVLPAESPARVMESGGPVAGAAGVRAVRVEGGQTVVEVGSGSYVFGFPVASGT